MSFRPVAVALTAVVFFCSSARASNSDVRHAYHDALRCFVMNGELMRRFQTSGDQPNAALREKAAHHAYDVAMGYGNVLAFSREQLSADVDSTTSAELSKLLDKSYLISSVDFCKSRGLV